MSLGVSQGCQAQFPKQFALHYVATRLLNVFIFTGTAQCDGEVFPVADRLSLRNRNGTSPSHSLPLFCLMVLTLSSNNHRLTIITFYQPSNKCNHHYILSPFYHYILPSLTMQPIEPQFSHQLTIKFFNHHQLNEPSINYLINPTITINSTVN